MPEAGTPMIGQTLGRYRIEAELGRGGMGVVYRARDTELGRTVALKVLPPAVIADPDRKRRFVQEARAASALNHPGIVIIHDIGSDAGVDFIVMEHVEGRTLDRIIPPNGLRIEDARRYAVAMADALSKAHGAGIVHRDLKPSNVIVADDGRVKILDFGLAKLVERTDAPDAMTRTAALTESGTVVGTAAYMSPEQADGRPVDARSDIFSFGSMLYEMVTGRRPFVGESYLSVLTKIVGEEPTPPGRIAANLPPELERVILRCLRKDPARRHQTMGDLKVTLEDLSIPPAGSTAAAVESRRAPRWPRATWAVAGVIPLLLAAAYFGTQTWRGAGDGPPPQAVPITSLPGSKRSPSFSPDGNQVAYSWNGPQRDNVDVYVQQVDAGSPLRITSDPAADQSPVWSPDGRWIAFLRQTADSRRMELRLVPPLGGSERLVAELHPDRPRLRSLPLAWSPDSTYIVATDSPGPSKADALFAVSVESGEKRQLTHPSDTLVLTDREPAISPDGRTLVFRRDKNPLTGELFQLPLGSGMIATAEPTRILAVGPYSYPRWTPDGKAILLSGKGALWKLALSASAPERLPFFGGDGLMPTAIAARSGGTTRLAYVRFFTDTNIWRYEASAPGAVISSPPEVAISTTRRDALPQLSPDGKRVVFVSDRLGEPEVWVADVTGSNAAALSAQHANPGFPRWSPDGQLIAYHSEGDDDAGDVFIVPAAGGKPRNLTNRPGPDAFPSFSRDGRWVYFASIGPDSVPGIWKIAISGGSPVLVAPASGGFAIESVDGTDLFYVTSSGMTQAGSLMRTSPNRGGTPLKLVDNVDPISFDVVERGIYYIEREAGETRLRFYDFATRTSAFVARNLGNLDQGLSASRDGRTILFGRFDSSVDDIMFVEHFR